MHSQFAWDQWVRSMHSFFAWDLWALHWKPPWSLSTCAVNAISRKKNIYEVWNLFCDRKCVSASVRITLHAKCVCVCVCVFPVLLSCDNAILSFSVVDFMHVVFAAGSAWLCVRSTCWFSVKQLASFFWKKCMQVSVYKQLDEKLQ